MPTKPSRHRPARAKRYTAPRATSSQRGPYCTKWWLTTRKRIARRDNWQCRKCGKDIGRAKGDFHCHHKQERPVGAPINTAEYDSDDNLTTWCDKCHNQHSARRHKQPTEGGRFHRSWRVAGGPATIEGDTMTGRQLFRPTFTASLVVVTGKPGSGKTTHVQEHKSHGDLVWDLDDVAKVIGGGDRHPHTQQSLPVLFAMRDAFIAALDEMPIPNVTAWMIVTDTEHARQLVNQHSGRYVEC